MAKKPAKNPASGVASRAEALIQGKPRRNGKKTLYLDLDALAELQQIAEEAKTSCSNLIDALIKDFLSKHRR